MYLEACTLALSAGGAGGFAACEQEQPAATHSTTAGASAVTKYPAPLPTTTSTITLFPQAFLWKRRRKGRERKPSNARNGIGKKVCEVATKMKCGFWLAMLSQDDFEITLYLARHLPLRRTCYYYSVRHVNLDEEEVADRICCRSPCHSFPLSSLPGSLAPSSSKQGRK